MCLVGLCVCVWCVDLFGNWVFLCMVVCCLLLLFACLPVYVVVCVLVVYDSLSVRWLAWLVGCFSVCEFVCVVVYLFV